MPAQENNFRATQQSQFSFSLADIGTGRNTGMEPSNLGKSQINFGQQILKKQHQQEWSEMNEWMNETYFYLNFNKYIRL